MAICFCLFIECQEFLWDINVEAALTMVGVEDEVLMGWNQDATARGRADVEEYVGSLIQHGSNGAEKAAILPNLKASEMLPREVCVVYIRRSELFWEIDIGTNETLSSMYVIHVLELQQSGGV